MCAAAAVPLAIAALTTTATAVMQNQAVQHAKGAAEAQQKIASETAAKTGPAQTTGPTPDNSQAAAAAQARKAAAMRAGIMSTIGPNLGSLGNTTPNMAYATGMKTALGQ